MSARGAAVRKHSLEELCAGTFDVLVIGTGIIGARVAFEAACAGLKVALVDAGDFGGATSGASGKLVHGGLRYLATGNVRLVRAALQERRVLADHIAPHLVHRLPFLLARSGRGFAGFPTVAASLLAYWALDGFRRPAPRPITAEEAGSLVPPLHPIGPYTLLEEAQTDDGRLTLATVKAAVQAGVVAANHLRVVELERSGGRICGAILEGHDGEGYLQISCRTAVNATGPWVDQVRLLEDPKREPSVQLSKGVHLLLAVESDWRAAVALHLGEASHVYAVPWHGMLLLGTTDTAYEGDPDAVAPDPSDEALLLDAASSFLPHELLHPQKVRCSFAGLRVLPSGEGTTYRAPREHVVSVGPAGMVSVGGGKLTTHRLIALDVLRMLPTELRPKKVRANIGPLPGASPPNTLALNARLDPPTVKHLTNLYGNEAEKLLSYATDYPNALEKIHSEGPDIWAQAYYAADEEWALTVEDVTRRRTSLSFRGLITDDARARLASALALPEGAAC